MAENCQKPTEFCEAATREQGLLAQAIEIIC